MEKRFILLLRLLVVLLFSIFLHNFSLYADEQPSLPSDTVVTVDGTPITKQDVFDLFIQRYGPQASEVTQELIVREIIKKESRHEKIKMPHSVIVKKAQENVAEIKRKVQENLGENWLEYLQKNGLSEKSLKQEAYVKWKYNLTLHHLIKLHQFRFPRVEARQIMVNNPEVAKSLRDKLLQGADFAALAKQHSKDDQTRPQGGKFPLLFKGELSEQIDQALWQMKHGEIGPVTKSSYGYHILQVIEFKKVYPNASWQKLAKTIHASLEKEPISAKDVERWLQYMNKKYKITKVFTKNKQK